MSWDKNDDAWGITILDRFNDTYFAATEQRNDIRRTDIEKIVKMALERSREDTIKEARENILADLFQLRDAINKKSHDVFKEDFIDFVNSIDNLK